MAARRIIKGETIHDWASRKRDEELARFVKHHNAELDAKGAIKLPADAVEGAELPTGEIAWVSLATGETWAIHSIDTCAAKRGERVITRPLTDEEKQIVLADLIECGDVEEGFTLI